MVQLIQDSPIEDANLLASEPAHVKLNLLSLGFNLRVKAVAGRVTLINTNLRYQMEAPSNPGLS